VSIETICADCGLDVEDLEDGHCGWSVCPYRARERRGEKPPSTDETRVRLQRAGSAYRLLKEGDVICATDERLCDDCQWETLDAGDERQPPRPVRPIGGQP
jgi:hypothetical protein